MFATSSGRLETRASSMLSKCSTTELHPSLSVISPTPLPTWVLSESKPVAGFKLGLLLPQPKCQDYMMMVITSIIFSLFKMGTKPPFLFSTVSHVAQASFELTTAEDKLELPIFPPSLPKCWIKCSYLHLFMWCQGTNSHSEHARQVTL